MWRLLKAEFSYHKATLLAYGLVVIGFAFLMPEWPEDVSSFLHELPVYLTFGMVFSMLSKAGKEKRERFAVLFPVSLKTLVVARVLLVIPFILGMNVLALTSSGQVLEEIGQQILFLNVVLFAMIHHDLGTFPGRIFRIIFYFTAAGYLGSLIAFAERIHLEVFFWGILFGPFLILLYSSRVIFMRRKSYLG